MMIRPLCIAAFTLAATPALATGRHECLDIGTAQDTAYDVIDHRNHNACGSVGDARIDAQQSGRTEDAVWFRLDDEVWVVRDPSITLEARRLFAKVNEIGGRQGAVGAQQGVIGAEQGRIGVKQAEVALRNLGTDRQDREVPAEAAARSERMRELGARMGILGRQQSALGEEMKREIAIAQRGLAELLLRAMKEDKAARIRRL